MIRTNTRINIRIKNIRIFEYSKFIRHTLECILDTLTAHSSPTKQFTAPEFKAHYIRVLFFDYKRNIILGSASQFSQNEEDCIFHSIAKISDFVVFLYIETAVM